VLKTLPETRERARQELDLQITLALALHASKGQAAPEVERAYARARELCAQGEDAPQLFRMLLGLYRFYGGRMQRQTARELVEQLYRLAQHVQDPDLLLQAHMARGTILLLLGEITTARSHLEQAIAFYNPQQHRSHAFRYSLDPGVISLSRASWALWLLGYPDQAFSRSQETLDLARELAHPPSLANALSFAATLHQFRQEGQETQILAEATVVLATEQGLAQWQAAGTFLRGWVLTAQGQGADGLAQLHQGLAAYRATGTVLDLPWYLGVLAEAYGRTGQAEAGLTTLVEALAAVDKTDFYEAELYRLKGTLLLGQTVPDVSQAEACFQQALAVARHQQAKSLELRAAMSLSRLGQQQGKRDEARRLVAAVYGWFTEGFDTSDLQDAKTLLEDLA
jgi:predicted ATPase